MNEVLFKYDGDAYRAEHIAAAVTTPDCEMRVLMAAGVEEVIYQFKTDMEAKEALAKFIRLWATAMGQTL